MIGSAELRRSRTRDELGGPSRPLHTISARHTAPRPSRPRPPAAALPLAAALAVAGAAAFAVLRRRRGKPAIPAAEGGVAARRRLHGGAAILAFSVLADSALEHYRGSFHNPAMFIAPAMAAVALATNARATARPNTGGAGRAVVGAAAMLTGLAGTGFHIYNLGKREGGFSWINLFYGAPLGAPAAIGMAGVFGLAASRLAGEQGRPVLLGLPAGPLLAALAAAGLIGTVAEAALLHFRGAFQDPFMYVPVTLPPIAAAALAGAAVCPTGALRRVAAALLGTTAIVGIAGVGFHAYGIHRNMGGWRNWSQTLLQGPPLPAPPGFTGMAVAGLGALSLLGEARP